MTGGSALINRLSRANFVFVSIPLRFPSALRATKSGWQIFYIYIFDASLNDYAAKNRVNYKNHGLVGTRRRKMVRARVYTGCPGLPWH